MNCALIAAAGSGSRTGLKENKIFYSFSGKSIIERTVDAFLNHDAIDGVLLVCAPNDIDRLKSIFGDRVMYALGGSTRGESVLSGLNLIKGKFDKVLIHDGARPFVTKEIIDGVLENITVGQGAVASVKVTDTVKVTDGTGRIIETPDRSALYAAQTPQGFMVDEIIEAYLTAGTELTDDTAVFEKAGKRTVVTEGSYSNKKITTKEDLFVEKTYFSGIGYDVHALCENRALVLGGVKVPHDKGLMGHSDADVLVHAIMDAILGGAGLGDIGRHFPDTDNTFKDIDSMLLFEKVVALVKEKGFQIVNISAIVVAQKPKLKDYIQTMNENIARVAGIDVSCVNVAATTTERLGFEGRQEGISSTATVMLCK